jgi:asparagine synthetase B (glutamine-hydrolysing)
MISQDQQHTIVFNGEIYNYQELESNLQLRGSNFSTHSDTEVILDLYRQMGKECVILLNRFFLFTTNKVKKYLLLETMLESNAFTITTTATNLYFYLKSRPS